MPKNRLYKNSNGTLKKSVSHKRVQYKKSSTIEFVYKKKGPTNGKVSVTIEKMTLNKITDILKIEIRVIHRCLYTKKNRESVQ